jgi:hypothetical protein
MLELYVLKVSLSLTSLIIVIGSGLTVRGWLQSHETLATIKDEHVLALQTTGEMVGDEVVTMLLL